MTLRFVSVAMLSILSVGLCRAVISQSKIDDSRFPQNPPTQHEPCLNYIKLSSALAFTKERDPIELHSYSVSDGTRVYASYFYYRSSKKAVREMNRKLASAIEIISREPLLDQKGRKAGVRAIRRFKSRVRGREFEVLWTEGSSLKTISGPSLSHVLQLLNHIANKH